MQELLKLGERHFAPLADFPEARAFWWPRLPAHRALVRGLGQRAPRRSDGAACGNPRRAEIPGGKTRIHFVGHRRPHRAAPRRKLRHHRLQDRRGAHRKAGAHGARAAIDAGSRHSARRQIRKSCRRAGFAKSPTSRSKAASPPANRPRSTSRKATPDSQAEHALARLKDLAAKFEDEATPYLSLVHPMWKTHYGDYDHLARVKEWSLGGGEDEVRMTARTIPPAVRDVQVKAADPEVSAFVSANAGSGKTYVLAQRVINLLLRGVDPAKILCITFTKTAAANMANEVFKRLAGWTALTDAALDERDRAFHRPQAEYRRARAGAPAIRLRAGDAGRPEGADHPRLLHAAAAPVPVRGQCRGAFHRAGRSLHHATARPADLGRAAASLGRSRTARSARRWRRPSSSPPTRPSRT